MDVVRYTEVVTPLGTMVASDRGDGLASLHFADQRHAPGVGPGWQRDPGPFRELAGDLDAYFAGEEPAFAVHLDLQGTALQRQVWGQLQRCPYGRTTTYGEVAAAIGRPTAVRAVANAVGRNPVALVVPCHRVLGADGSLTGYAAGLARKERLLALEGVVVA